MKYLEFLVFLQIAVLGLISSGSVGDTVSLCDVSSAVFGPALQRGAPLPQISVQDGRGHHIISGSDFKRATIVILSGCAPCNATVVQSWQRAAKLRRFEVVTVFDADPTTLPAIRSTWKLDGILYSNGTRFLYRRLGIRRLPTQVLVSNTGIVKEVID